MKNKIPHPRVLSLVLFVAAALLMTTSVRAQYGDQEAQLIKVPTVQLPNKAKEKGVGGIVTATVSVDASGKVTSVDNVAGPGWVCPDVNTPAVAALRRVAREAAVKAKFAPAMRNGAAVASKANVNFDFNAPASKEMRLDRKPEFGGLVAVDPSSAKIVTAGDAPGEIHGEVINGKAVKLAKPPYPPAARAVRASGTVHVQVLIETDGTVYTAAPVSGHPLLRSSARMSACSSKFTPTLLSGQPVKVSGIITYNFVP